MMNLTDERNPLMLHVIIATVFFMLLSWVVWGVLSALATLWEAFGSTLLDCFMMCVCCWGVLMIMGSLLGLLHP